MKISIFYYALLIWLGGYVVAKLDSSFNANKNYFIKVPKVLYILLGKPRNKNTPLYYVPIPSAYWQISSLFVTLGGLIMLPLDTRNQEWLYGLIIIMSLILTLLIKYLFEKNK